MGNKDDITLRDLLRRHIEDSNKFRENMTESITRIETHNEYTHEKLKLVDKHEAAHNKQRGVLWFLSLVGIAEVTHFVTELFKSSGK